MHMKSLILQLLEGNKCQTGEICLGLWLAMLCVNYRAKGWRRYKNFHGLVYWHEFKSDPFSPEKNWGKFLISLD